MLKKTERKGSLFQIKMAAIEDILEEITAINTIKKHFMQIA